MYLLTVNKGALLTINKCIIKDLLTLIMQYWLRFLLLKIQRCDVMYDAGNYFIHNSKSGQRADMDGEQFYFVYIMLNGW